MEEVAFSDQNYYLCFIPGVVKFAAWGEDILVIISYNSVYSYGLKLTSKLEDWIAQC